MRKKVLLGIALAMIYTLVYADILRCTSDEKRVYLANKEKIDSLLLMQYQEEVVKINNSYHVPVEGRERIEFFIKNREFKYICQNFLYKDSLEKRVQNKMAIEKVFRDSINTILIPAHSNHISGDNISYALRCRLLLGLDSAQYSYMMDRALDMARRIRKNRSVNLWNEEMEILKRTLDKRQLRLFFKRKNATKITEEFNKAWAKLEKADLTEQLDSAKDAKDAVNYMHSRQMIKDLYRSYGTSQKKYLAELDKSKPKMMKMLDGIDKKARVEEKKKTIGKEFIW